MTVLGRAPPTGLETRLANMIDACGPMSVDTFMAHALYDPQAGYYATRLPLGSHGDFITSPEISQIFGELVGLWVAQSWLDLGSPSPFNLIELGPGRGTLMADMLRVCDRVPGFMAALHLHLVETNPALREAQRAALRTQPALWHDSLNDVPQGDSFIIANEFLDCLPVRQFVRGEQGWHEKLIGVGAEARLTFGLGPALAEPPACASPDDEIGAVREVAPGLEGLVESLAERLRTGCGRALIIDYGDLSGQAGDSLQALYRHQKIHALDHVGEADLTAHVDFAALISHAKACGLGTSGPASQRQFLQSLGIEARRDALIRANPHCESDLTRSVERLIGEAHMGGLFHVVALESPLNAAAGPPIGL
ncbi:MAG: methyltransferase [Alphaproteobacteria bacterium PA3]|nr:MAG: methyltransferase [Alphaproteobacteria bacterium PA3]